jgi:hypothetical protein
LSKNTGWGDTAPPGGDRGGDRARDQEKRADRDAASAAVERVYEDKARLVEKHRRRSHPGGRQGDPGGARPLRESSRGGRAGARRTGRLPSRHALGRLLSRRAREPVPRGHVGARAQLARAGRGGVSDHEPDHRHGRLPGAANGRDLLAEAMTQNQALELGAADPQGNAAVWTGTPEGRERRFARSARRRASATGASGARSPAGSSGAWWEARADVRLLR